MVQGRQDDCMTGKITFYSDRVSAYVRDTVNELNLGSDVLVTSLAVAGSFEWTKARPSTLANAIVFLVASGIGSNLETDILKKRVSTRPTLREWSSYIREVINI